MRSNPIVPISLPPSHRAAPEELRTQALAVAESAVAGALLQAVDGLMLVLNPQRQIVASNLPERLGRGMSVESVFGLRPGEALGCNHTHGDSPGCGNTDACRNCGALGAILRCREEGRPMESEALLTLGNDGAAEAVEFNVRATPVTIGEHQLVVVSLRDISGQKRREALEQIFFHDVLNTVAGLSGWSERLQRLPMPGDELREASRRIATLARRLEREVKDQRDLRLAEEGTLRPRAQAIAAEKLLHEVEVLFASQPVARERTLSVAPPSPPFEMETDPALLLRVITNMVKNALEATAAEGTVRLWSEHDAANGSCAFHVWNDAVIPRHVASRIFQRSFTTHAERGRGLGTYSMVLLGERYLGGQVSFTTDAEHGTVFTIRVPLRFPSMTGSEKL